MKTRSTLIPALLGTILCLPVGAMAQDGADTNVSTSDSDGAAAVADSNDAVDNKTADDADSNDAVDNKTADDADSEDEEDKGWGLSAGVTFDIGLGAFTKHEYARRIRSRFAMELSGYYTIPVIDVDISLTTGFSVWMSKAGDSNGKHAFRWADSSLNLSREIWSYATDDKDFAFNLGFDLGFTLPTSQASITSKLYTQLVPSLSASIKLGKFSFSYVLSYGHNFNKYTSITMNPDEVDVLSRNAGVELINASAIAQDGVLTEIELANAFTFGYQFLDNFGLTVGLGVVDAWTYDNGTITEEDQFTSEYAHVGRGHSQFSQGIVSLSYKPASWVGLSLSMVSTQPWKTADNKTLRFPWFDTVSPSKNYTKFILGASFTY